MIINSNWLIHKLLQIEMMNVEDLLRLEFCGDKDFLQFKGTRTAVKEVPYMKNNPRILEESLNKDEGLIEKPAEQEKKPMTEKEKRIAALRASLLAPVEPRKKKAVESASGVDSKDSMESKFTRKMYWGTPRLVTKNRMLKVEDPKTLASRAFLLNMANSRKGNVAELP